MGAQVNFIQAINQALFDAMEGDEKVLMLGEDVGDAQDGGILGVTKGLSNKFGELRVRSTPISEQAIIGAAIGAAIRGYRPVAEIMLMNFTAVAMDMIVNHAAKLRFMSGGQTNVPMTIRTMTGAGSGNGGQHSDYLEAWFAHTAGIRVVTASSPADAYGLMLSCIADNDPCLFIENMPSYWVQGPAPKKGARIPLGKANVLREGRDVTLISYGRTIMDCQVVAEKLSGEGVEAEIVDLRTIAPYDKQTLLDSVSKTRRAVVVHEAVTPFGVGAEIAAMLQKELWGTLAAPIERVGSNFSAVPFSKTLETAYVPRHDAIHASVKSTLQ